MASNSYLGYVGGMAVAVGMGAAIAAAAQGSAHADAGKAESSNTSDAGATGHAGPKKTTKPGANGTARSGRPKPVAKVAAATTSEVTSDVTKAVSEVPDRTQPSVKWPTPAEFEAEQVAKLEGLFARPRAAAATEGSATGGSATQPSTTTAAAVPWSPNPFRPMPPEPAPNDMPGVVWGLEQTVVGAFPDAVKPLPREAIELGYRLTQMVPWVNVIVPLTNIVNDLPTALSGDKSASQRIVNNLIVTIHPVSVLYYGYNEIADLVNLEQQALDLQNWGISTAWNVLDPFALLHNRGESGLPLSTTTPPPYPPIPTPYALAAAVTPTPGPSIQSAATAPDPNPFRADDPWPTTMPTAVLSAEKALLAAIPAPLEAIAPFAREVYEAVYRGTQIVPYANAVVPVSKILPALIQAAQGNRAGAQVTINQLLLTTGPISLLFYGFDQLADLLNIEDSADTARQALYTTLWDSLDPTGLLHVPGQSGL